MKRVIICIAFLMASIWAEANPLFYPHVRTIVKTDNYEYFYDDAGDLVGREDIGSAGFVYWYNGESFEEEGYFVSENGWTLYYDNITERYVGKGSFSNEYYKDNYGETRIRSTSIYVDERNRPVATYFGRNINNSFGTLFDSIENILNPLRAIEQVASGEGVRTRIILQLQGKVRLYDD